LTRRRRRSKIKKVINFNLKNMVNNPDRITTIPSESQKQRSFDELISEYHQWCESLPEEERNQKHLWEKFLLQTIDDRSYTLERAVTDALQGRQRDITKMVQDSVREGRLEQIIPELNILGKITNALSQRYDAMWTTDKAKGRNERITSPPIPLNLD
jgi:hypothetical protein